MVPTANLPTICFGEVLHKRTSPKINAFRYAVFFLRIPMVSRSLNPEMLSKNGVGDNRFSWISFYDEDHGIGGKNALAWVRNQLQTANIDGINGEIWLQTFPRILGLVFNPVSFWFCHTAEGQLKAILAEVNNTFGGRHCYLLQSDQTHSIAFGQTLIAKKVFHVSPFYDVAGQYLFRFMRKMPATDARNVSRIEYWLKNELQLSTSISGRELPLTRRNIARAVLKFPMLSFGILFKIHWQAMKLWFKGVTFYGKNPPSTHN